MNHFWYPLDHCMYTFKLLFEICLALECPFLKIPSKVLKNKSGEGTGRKKFHFAKTKRGRTMIVQEQKGTDDAKEMYHLVPKTKIKPRWDFEKTVKAISSKYIEPTFEKELQKVVDKF